MGSFKKKETTQCIHHDHLDMPHVVSWYYNYLPVPDAEYTTPWWCHYNDTGAVPAGPHRWVAGTRVVTCRHVSSRAACRQRCFPTPASNVTFVPMIRWGGLMGDCGEAVCGGDVPDQYQVGAAGGQ